MIISETLVNYSPVF